MSVTSAHLPVGLSQHYYALGAVFMRLKPPPQTQRCLRPLLSDRSQTFFLSFLCFYKPKSFPTAHHSQRSPKSQWIPTFHRHRTPQAQLARRERRAKFSNVLHPFQSENLRDQILTSRLPHDRRNEISAFCKQLLHDHRIFHGAPDGEDRARCAACRRRK